MSLTRERLALVVDIGGGTMHVVLVQLSPRGAMAGEAQVLANIDRMPVELARLGANIGAQASGANQYGAGLQFEAAQNADDANAAFWGELGGSVNRGVSGLFNGTGSFGGGGGGKYSWSSPNNYNIFD